MMDIRQSGPGPFAVLPVSAAAACARSQHDHPSAAVEHQSAGITVVDSGSLGS